MPALVLAAVLSATLDPAFTESIALVPPTAFSATGMEWAPDGSGRLFVIGQGGGIYVVKNGAFLPFATLAPVYAPPGECGLIGMAFDPDFITNGWVYFFTTVSATEQQIVRLTAVGDVGTQYTVIVRGLATLGLNHDGGGLVFGFDGKLYWSVGDNGSYVGVGNDLASTAAKVGRVNRDGTIPGDNPYVGVPMADARIWASGFRNPFTMSVQPRTGKIWVNNVGASFETIFAPSAGQNAGYNLYEVSQLPPYLRPILWYRTNGAMTYPLLTATRAANVTTFTTALHHVHVGQNLTITGVADPSFNGPGQIVTSVPSDTDFTVAQAGPNASSTGGQLASLVIGGSITGGAFLDTSAVPAAYRNNFFFADFNTGNVTRVAIGPTHLPSAVTPFGDGLGNIVDTAVGPDGAIYVLRYSGSIVRYAFNAPSATGLVVTPLSRNMLEGGQAAFNVALAVAPTANVTLTAIRTSGDADVTVTAGSTLTFTPANWNVPQTVRLHAAQDADTANDAAVVTVMGGALTPEAFDVSVTDDDRPAILLAPPFVSIPEGSAAIVQVSLEFAPPAPVTVTVARTAGDADVSVTAGATLIFDAANYATPQSVTVLAAEDADTLAGTATVSVTAPGFPSRTLAVTEVENDAVAPIITSPPADTATVNAPWRYDVDATGVPGPTFALLAGPAGMALNPTTGVLTWTPPAEGAFAVRVRAANGIAPDWDQNFVLSVGPDLPPTAVLTKPQPNDVVSGKNAEFFGDGVDDVGTVKGVFSVDGIDVFTDTTTGNHFHLGGAHNQWDTTALANGPHTVRLTVTDTAGHTAFAEAAVTVDNPAPTPDAGPTPRDAGLPAVDGGLGPVSPSRGCGCAASPDWLSAAALLLPMLRRVRRRSPTAARRA